MTSKAAPVPASAHESDDALMARVEARDRDALRQLAERLGLKRGLPVTLSTANGRSQGYRTHLERLQLGDLRAEGPIGRRWSDNEDERMTAKVFGFFGRAGGVHPLEVRRGPWHLGAERACKKKGDAQEQKKSFHTFINSASFEPTTFSISATALSVSFCTSASESVSSSSEILASFSSFLALSIAVRRQARAELASAAAPACSAPQRG